MKIASSQCARCGACTVVCPVYRAEARESATARGRMHLLTLDLAKDPTDRFEEIFSRCLLCGACEQVCSRNLPITELVILARNRFPELYGPHPVRKKAVRTALAHPVFLKNLVRAGIRLGRLKRLPISSGLRLKLGLMEKEESQVIPVPPSVPASHAEILYFSGCLARHVQPSIGRATVRLAHVCGHAPHAPEAQGCCGLAALAAGRMDEARELAWQNIQAFADTSGPILTSCASCFRHLQQYGKLFADDPKRRTAARAFAGRISEFSAFFLEQPGLFFSLPAGRRVLYHDPCHQRYTPSGMKAPRQLLDRVAGLIRIEPEDGPRCCGQGGLFQIAFPELSARIFKRCLEAALPGQPDIVTTTCSGCLMQWRAGVREHNLSIRVAHLAVLLAEWRQE